MKLFKFCLGLLLSWLWWEQLLAAPIFSGPEARSSGAKVWPRSLVYMTAEQMAGKVRSLTGFYQPGFEDFARIIGTFDPKVGSRTNDRPTALSVLILEGLLSEVASSVVIREIFLDSEDRLVFVGMDLSSVPSLEQLRSFTRRLCQEWLAQTCPTAMEDDLMGSFRELADTNLMAAWETYLSLFLQNGSLYYL